MELIIVTYSILMSLFAYIMLLCINVVVHSELGQNRLLILFGLGYINYAMELIIIGVGVMKFRVGLCWCNEVQSRIMCRMLWVVGDYSWLLLIIIGVGSIRASIINYSFWFIVHCLIIVDHLLLYKFLCDGLIRLK